MLRNGRPAYRETRTRPASSRCGPAQTGRDRQDSAPGDLLGQAVVRVERAADHADVELGLEILERVEAGSARSSGSARRRPRASASRGPDLSTNSGMSTMNVRTIRSGGTTSRYSPRNGTSSPPLVWLMKLQRPPVRTSISTTVVVSPWGPHQFVTRAGSVMTLPDQVARGVEDALEHELQTVLIDHRPLVAELSCCRHRSAPFVRRGPLGPRFVAGVAACSSWR